MFKFDGWFPERTPSSTYGLPFKDNSMKNDKYPEAKCSRLLYTIVKIGNTI